MPHAQVVSTALLSKLTYLSLRQPSSIHSTNVIRDAFGLNILCTTANRLQEVGLNGCVVAQKTKKHQRLAFA